MTDDEKTDRDIDTEDTDADTAPAAPSDGDSAVGDTDQHSDADA